MFDSNNFKRGQQKLPLPHEIPPIFRRALATTVCDDELGDFGTLIGQAQSRAARALARHDDDEQTAEVSASEVGSLRVTNKPVVPHEPPSCVVARLVDENRRHLDRAMTSAPDVIEPGLMGLPDSASLRLNQKRFGLVSTGWQPPSNTASRSDRVDEAAYVFFTCMCGVENADETHLRQCRFFKDTWEAALRAFVASRGSPQVRRLVTKVTAHQLCDDPVALCSLVESKGDVGESVRKLADSTYLRDMTLVTDLHDVASFVSRPPPLPAILTRCSRCSW